MVDGVKVFQPASVGVGVGLLATAAYLPEERRSNAALEALGCPLTADEMERLSGILERRIAAPDQATSDLAAAAATAALACAGRDATALDRILLSTTSSDYLVPSTACLVAHRIGVEQAPALDLAAACGGFLFALDAGDLAVATGEQTVLAIAAEIVELLRSTCATGPPARCSAMERWPRCSSGASRAPACSRSA